MPTIDDERPEDDSERKKREEEEARGPRKGRPSLDEEIARKYDAGRLSRIVVGGAGRGERLDLATRGRAEQLLPGHDFSTVRVFRGALAEEVTARHQADAVTIGNTGMILVRDSARAAPGTSSAQALIAHELAHVAQAQRGFLFAKEHDGQDGEHQEHAAHEQEARGVEHASASGGGAGAGGHGGPNDEGGDSRKLEAKRKTVVDRAIELWDAEKDFAKHRRGMF